MWGWLTIQKIFDSGKFIRNGMELVYEIKYRSIKWLKAVAKFTIYG